LQHAGPYPHHVMAPPVAPQRVLGVGMMTQVAAGCGDAAATGTSNGSRDAAMAAGGWESLLEADSGYVASLQRMLQSACQTADSSQLPPMPPQAPPQQLQRQGLPMPADEGAGSYALHPVATEARWDAQDSGRGPLLSPAATAPFSSGSSAVATAPSPGTVGYGGAAGVPSEGAMARVQDVSSEVLRLRLLKSQHEELNLQVQRAQGQLRRLSPHTIFQLRSYFEHNLKDVALASQLQEAMVCLLQCLCIVAKIEANAQSPEALLSSARKLFRDPHSFTSKLCNMSMVSSEEAKVLSPYLLPCSQFKRVREKEVNDCYDAFFAWLSSFHMLSLTSDQVGPVAQELERQEWLLRRLTSQVEEVPPRRVSVGVGGLGQSPSFVAAPSSSPATSVAVPVASGRGPAVSSGGTEGLRSPVRTAGVGARSGAVASPLGRTRGTIASGPAVISRSSAVGTGPRARTATGGEGGSRSVSPSTRPRVHGSSSTVGAATNARPRMTGTASSVASTSRISPHRGAGHAVGSAAAPAGGASVRRLPEASATSSTVLGSNGSVVGVSSASAVAAATAAAAAAAASAAAGAGDAGLTRVQSEKTLTRSPRTRQRDSRSPSPGCAGRGSPMVASRSVTSRPGVSPSSVVRPKMSPPSRAVSGVLPGGNRDAGVVVRLAGGSAAAAPRATASSTAAPAGPTAHGRPIPASPAAARPKSPDKGGGPTRDGPVESTPRSGASSGRRPVTSAAAAAAAADDDESGSESDGDGGPRRRRLSKRQYEALLRCAQRVVSTSGGGVAPIPPPLPPSASAAAASLAAAPVASAGALGQAHASFRPHLG